MSERPPFRAYRSLTNHTSKKFFEYAKAQEGVWIATEKIHGCNASYWTDGKEVWCAKRTSFLGNDTEFFTVAQFMQKNSDSIKSLHDGSAPYTIVFGEFFGGDNGKDCDKPIQRGVFYAKKHHFMVFDLATYDGVADFYNLTDVDEARSRCESAGLLFTPELTRGTFDEVFEWSTKHYEDDSSIPEILGDEFLGEKFLGEKFLGDELPEGRNLREGHVLRPVVPAYLPDHSALIMKHKNEKFTERQNRKFVKNARSREQKMSDEVAPVYDLFSSGVTEARFDNLCSKYPHDTTPFGHLLKLYAEDIVNEVCREDGITLSKSANKDIMRLLRKHAAKSMREWVQQRS